MTNSKFKIGDRVRIIADITIDDWDSKHGIPLGTTSVITDIYDRSDYPYYIEASVCPVYSFRECELQLEDEPYVDPKDDLEEHF